MALTKKKRVSSAAKAEFTLRLFDDLSTRNKLEKSAALEVMFSDARNRIPASYIDICTALQPGDTLRIVVEKLPAE